MLPQIWGATYIFFCNFRQYFTLLPPLLTLKIKIWKKYKKTWRYQPFTHVHHKSRSYDVWFLRYKVQRTECFVILGHFLPFDSPSNPKNQNFEKIKKLNILSFYTSVWSYDVWFLGYWEQQTECFVIKGYFLPFYLFFPFILFYSIPFFIYFFCWRIEQA